MENLIFILVGVVLLVAGIYHIFKSDRIRENGVKVPALVVDMEFFNERRKVMYNPVIEFETLEGKKVVKAYEIASQPSRFRKGDQLEVVYNKDNPEEFEPANEPFLTTSVPFMLMLAGAVLVVLGVYRLLG